MAWKMCAKGLNIIYISCTIKELIVLFVKFIWPFLYKKLQKVTKVER